jgi:serine/threonine protein kinase
MATATKDQFYFDRFRLISKLGEGSFGKIYKGIDTVSNRLVAIKVEQKGGSSQLKTESKIYKELEGTPVSKGVRWPKMYDFGRDTLGNNIMIMDLLGPNIESIMKKSVDKHLSGTSVAFLAEKMITLVERFHMAGYVHRDLKPQNFVIEYCEQTYPRFPEVFLIDYGLAKGFLDSTKKEHAPFSQKKSLKGTVRYSSCNTHLGIDQSRRDDMQSLAYIFIYMLLGRLPWQNLMKDRDKKEAYHLILLKKMSTPIEELAQGIQEPMRNAVISYFLYANSLMYHEEPNYNYCRSLFYDILTEFTGNLFSQRRGIGT